LKKLSHQIREISPHMLLIFVRRLVICFDTNVSIYYLFLTGQNKILDVIHNVEIKVHYAV
jgi:hypothetical protein